MKFKKGDKVLWRKNTSYKGIVQKCYTDYSGSYADVKVKCTMYNVLFSHERIKENTLIKTHGILLVESEDKEGETVLLSGIDLKLDHAPVKSASGNLLGKITGHSIIYRAINDDSCKLAMLAGLVISAPVGNENVLTGHSQYLDISKPFVKISATLLENSNLKMAIKAGNLFFNFSGRKLERKGSLITKCVIDSVTVGLSFTQKETRIYLEE